jgi:hypothetical protein
MECEVTFLSKDEGGRQTGLPHLSGNSYRPLLVVGDPNQRKAIIQGRMVPVEYADGTRGEEWAENYGVEEHLGVFFESGPEDGRIGEPLLVTLLLPFWQAIPEYGKFQPGATFTLREGATIVGYGKAIRWLRAPDETEPS